MNWIQSVSRRNQVMAGILVLQLVLAAAVFWPRPASGGVGEPLLAGLEKDQVVQVTIQDEQGQDIVLAKQMDKWVLPNAGDFPCQEDKVPALLDQIAGIKTDRLVTQTRSSHKQLKVADTAFVHRVELELGDGKVQTLYLGTSPSYGTTHVRADGQDQVYLASGFDDVSVGASVTSWIDTQYVSIPTDEVVALTLENANGRFEFRKEGETWAMADLAADETLDEATVTSLVSRVSAVNMLRPLGTEAQADYGMDTPHAVVTVETRSAEGETQTVTLQVGAQSGEDNSFVLKSSASPYYVQVAEYTVQDWVEKQRDDWMQLPPTPTPTPASSS